MYCGKLEIKNNCLEISNLTRIVRKPQRGVDESPIKYIPRSFNEIIKKVKINENSPDKSLCNFHFIEINDFDKDLYEEISPNEYLEVLFQTKNHIFKSGKDYKAMLPTLHISILDFFDSVIAASPGVIIPRCLKYIDSSIWHYYVPIHLNSKRKNRKSESVDFQKRLQCAIDSILENTNRGLYNLSVTQEQADFYARIISQSYLTDIGAHKKRISPFLFHSEQEIKHLLLNREIFSTYMPEIKGMNKIDGKDNSSNRKAKWRFLLVDDYGKDSMKTYPLGYTTFCKKDWIKKVLTSLFVDSDCIDLECVSSVNDAVIKLKEQRFDVILLDYLLGYQPGGQREYGYDLLERMKDKGKQDYRELQDNKGPFGKYWIFPITSFDEAFAQKMREKGWSYNSEDWFLAQGACPLDTPESFKYYLCKLMNSQLKGLGIKLKKCNLTEVYTLTQFLMAIFENKEEARKRALKNFNALYLLKANYGKLKADIRIKNKEFISGNQSAASQLVESIFEDINKYDDEFWEHIVFMMYITAYPPANQWFRLSHEYLSIKGAINNEVGEKIVDYINYMKSM